MNRRWVKLAISILGFGIVGIAAYFVAASHMDPVPAAEVAAANAGWKKQQLTLESFDVSGGPLGSSAIVRYHLHESDEAKRLEVHLRRTILSRDWTVVRVEAK